MVLKVPSTQTILWSYELPASLVKEKGITHEDSLETIKNFSVAAVDAPNTY